MNIYIEYEKDKQTLVKLYNKIQDGIIKFTDPKATNVFLTNYLDVGQVPLIILTNSSKKYHSLKANLSDEEKLSFENKVYEDYRAEHVKWNDKVMKKYEKELKKREWANDIKSGIPTFTLLKESAQLQLINIYTNEVRENYVSLDSNIFAKDSILGFKKCVLKEELAPFMSKIYSDFLLDEDEKTYAEKWIFSNYFTLDAPVLFIANLNKFLKKEMSPENIAALSHKTLLKLFSLQDEMRDEINVSPSLAKAILQEPNSYFLDKLDEKMTLEFTENVSVVANKLKNKGFNNFQFNEFNAETFYELDKSWRETKEYIQSMPEGVAKIDCKDYFEKFMKNLELPKLQVKMLKNRAQVLIDLNSYLEKTWPDFTKKQRTTSKKVELEIVGESFSKVFVVKTLLSLDFWKSEGLSREKADEFFKYCTIMENIGRFPKSNTVEVFTKKIKGGHQLILKIKDIKFDFNVEDLGVVVTSALMKELPSLVKKVMSEENRINPKKEGLTYLADNIIKNINAQDLHNLLVKSKEEIETVKQKPKKI